MADAARAMKVADRIKTVTAANLDKVIKDPDLGFVTITDVRVTGDLQHSSIFYTVFGDESQRAKTAALLEANRGKLRSVIGKQLGIRLTPSVEFIPDAIPETASHLDALLREAKERDAVVAASAQGKTYAGDADPYKKPLTDEDMDAEDEDAEDEDAVDEDFTDAEADPSIPTQDGPANSA